MLAELRERDATGEIAAIYDERVVNTSPLRHRAVPSWARRRDIIFQTRTLAAPGADATAPEEEHREHVGVRLGAGDEAGDGRRGAGVHARMIRGRLRGGLTAPGARALRASGDLPSGDTSSCSPPGDPTQAHVPVEGLILATQSPE